MFHFLGRKISKALCADCAHIAAVFNGSVKDAEAASPDNLGQINNFHAETEVRLVGSETVHGFLPGHALNRKLYVHIETFFKKVCQQPLVDIHDIFRVHKGKLHIDLGKLRLAVRTKILVTETFCQLEIPVVAGAH